MLNAEAEGVTQTNVTEMLASPNPAVRRLLGLEGGFGAGLGLSNDWVVAIVKAVGNYGRASNAIWARARRSKSRAA